MERLNRTIRVLPILLLYGVACSGCTGAVIQSGYQAVMLRHPTLPQAYATTTCSLNNLPIILVDSVTWASDEREIALAHEQVHADRAFKYRGGCWPFMYRIQKDKAFRAKEQLLAFCEAGRYAVRRNRNPETVWNYIVNVMASDTTLTSRDNCLYEPWETTK